jgi:hypothetical protein
MKTKYLLGAALIAACSCSAWAQRADGVYHIACIVQMKDAANGTKTGECTDHPRENAVTGIGGRVSFDVVTTHELMDEEGAPEVTDLILFVDGQALPGTHPVVESQTDTALPGDASSDKEGGEGGKDYVVTFRVTFPVRRDLSSDKGKESWKKLLAGLGKERKTVPLSVGLINGPPLPSTYHGEFVRLGSTGILVFMIVAGVLGVGFYLIAGRTGALRDKEPTPDGRKIEPTERAYSLSRTQIAIWTLLVVYAYLFIWIVTGEYNQEIPRTILAILGISAGTYATAVAVDKDKEQGTPSRAATTVANTEGPVKDMFSLQNGAGLHRVQFGLWSVVLMIVFVVTVYDGLAMPDFNVGLLGLMGISSATYAGLKIPEKK